jgi:hypothetical protein
VLEIGAVTEKVTVTAGTPLVNTVNAQQLVSHGTTEVREMPLARRDWTNLLNVGTGVEVRGSRGGTGISMNCRPAGSASPSTARRHRPIPKSRRSPRSATSI